MKGSLSDRVETVPKRVEMLRGVSWGRRDAAAITLAALPLRSRLLTPHHRTQRRALKCQIVASPIVDHCRTVQANPPKQQIMLNVCPVLPGPWS